ncbi:E3 SUMO-protein ligase KIAA1586-like [Ptychodera flava]|uniref:E3 SUMO-protein ligase KIAA1586-like n=1 Tax=Ptychodera flava TaxID=63121 RepID=UPI00396A16B3
MMNNFTFPLKACFPWLEYDQDSKLMSCKWCKKAGNRNSFTSPGCPYLLKDYCTKHARIGDHKAAADARVYAPAFQDVVSNAYCKEEATVKAAMTNIYYMAKKNCPNDHFSDLNWLTIMQGCDELKGLKVDAHTNYEHPNSIHSFQEAMKLVIDEKMVLELLQSEFFAVLTDEMADIAMDKTVIIYLRYLVQGTIKVRFFEVVGLDGTSADDIYNTIVSVLEGKGLKLNKMCAVATDGASVMTGKHKGVTTLLKQDNPFIIRTHCIAHRLALAAAQASHAIPYLDKFGEKLNQIYNYFHYSTKHKSKLTKIFSVLNMELRRQFVRPCDTRWLSVGGAVDAVLANLNPLIMCLSDDAYPNTGTGDATAVGLFKYVTTYQFLATLHFMSDVLKQLNFLSKTFQKSDSDCSIVYSHVTAKSDTFKNMKVNAGQRLLEFLNMVPNEPDETGKFYLKMFEVGKPVQPSFVLTLPEGAEGIAISDNQNYRKWFQSSREKYIDKLVSNLSDRFDDLGLLGAFKIFVPSNYPPTSSEEYKTYGEQEIDALCEHYGCERNGKDGRICKQ